MGANRNQIEELEKQLNNTERELTNCREILDTVLEGTKSGYWDWNIKEGTDYLSPSFKQMLGYEDHELPSEPGSWKQVMHPDDLPQFIAAVNKHSDTKEQAPFQQEVRYYHKNGSLIWVVCQGKVLEWDSQGKPLRFVGSYLNITDKKDTESTLKESDMRFHLTFGNLGVGMALVGLDGRPMVTNAVLQKMLDYTNEELTRMTFADFTHPEDATQDWSLYKDLIAGKIQNYSMEKRYIRKGGKEIWADLSVSLARDQLTNEPLYAIGIVKDISEKKKAMNDLLRSGKQLEQFAYVASHDLQEPLRTVNSFTSMFLEKYKGQLDQEADEYLGYINEASNRMKDLINALLDYSRIDKKHAIETIDCNELTATVVQDMDTLIKETKTEIAIGRLPTLPAYKTELRLLFQNLISNAIKFRKPEVNPKIKIEATKEGGFWQFALSDNGIGIDDQFREKVFMIFQRLHPRTEYEGTGIGLAHCKKIIQMHEGNIWVESTLNVGSTFYFTIPI